MEIFNPTEKLELLAASASEIHAASERGKLRVEFKSDEDRTKKRQVRLLKNRQSAALSRQRKKEYITDLEERTNGLITENHELVQKIGFLSSVNVECKMHIETLEKILSETRNENSELKARLASLTNTTSTPSPSSTTTTATTATTTSPTSPTSTNVPTAEKEDTHMSSPPIPSPTLAQQPQPSSNP